MNYEEKTLAELFGPKPNEMPEDVMTQEQFNALPEYSCTIPTGVVIGKKWRRREPYHDRDGPPFYWYTGEYIPDQAGDPKMAGIEWRRVVIRR